VPLVIVRFSFSSSISDRFAVHTDNAKPCGQWTYWGEGSILDGRLFAVYRSESNAPGMRLPSLLKDAGAALLALLLVLEWPDARAGNAAAGRATFVSICSSCHGLDGVAVLEYAPSFSRCERLDQDDAKLLASVRDGVGGRMPPWGDTISEREILDAIAYARTFCKGPRNAAQH
jgi:mono/diheme cytochrome c family protein